MSALQDSRTSTKSKETSWQKWEYPIRNIDLVCCSRQPAAKSEQKAGNSAYVREANEIVGNSKDTHTADA